MKTVKKRSVNIAGLITQVQQQLTYLDKKMDILISQTSARPIEVQQPPKPSEDSQPVQRYEQPVRQREVRQANNYEERVRHKTVCAECNKECEVPFRPTGERPVYCRECFSKRKVTSSFKDSTDHRSRGGERNRERPSHRHESGEGRRPYAKKTFAKKWKKHP
jgi:CxxC-x17-CxxC domain-containing protein